MVCRVPQGWESVHNPVKVAPPRSSPQRPALIPEGVEPVIAGLGAFRGDGQQVGGAAASLDAACKTTHIGPRGQWGHRSRAALEPSHLGRTKR